MGWLMSSVLAIDDTVCFQEPTLQTTQVHQDFQFLDPNGNTNQGASSSSSGNSFLFMEFSELLATELEKQRLEMDWYLQFQDERLRTVLHEQTRQRAVLLQRCESKIMSLIRQKNEDLKIATEKAMELQNCLIKAEMEVKAWQKKTLENETVVLDLNNKLNQLTERDSLFSNKAKDAESFCDSSNIGNREGKEKQNCKSCHARSTCVLFLPCKHLCSCTSCEANLGFCPVCGSVKTASMEVFFV